MDTMAFGSSGFYRSGSSITDVLTTNNTPCSSARGRIDTTDDIPAHTFNDIVILLREQRQESTKLFTQLQQDIAALQGYVDAKLDGLVASSSSSSSDSSKLPLDLSVSVDINATLY